MNPSRFIAMSIFILLSLLSTLDAGEIDGRISIVTKKGGPSSPPGVSVGLYDQETLLKEIKAREVTAAPAITYFKKEQSKLIDRFDVQGDKIKEDEDKLARIEEDPKHTDKERADQHDTILEDFKVGEDIINKRNRYDYLSLYAKSGFYLFRDLPPPIQNATSDENGHFIFQTDKGNYVVVAKVTVQDTDDSKRTFYWMFKVTMGDEPKVAVLLDNDSQTQIRTDMTKMPPRTVKNPSSLIWTMDDDSERHIEAELNSRDFSWVLGYMEHLQKADATDAAQKSAEPSPAP